MVYTLIIAAAGGAFLSAFASVGFVLIVTLLAIVGSLFAGLMLGDRHLVWLILSGYAAFLSAFVLSGTALSRLSVADFEAVKDIVKARSKQQR